MQSDWTRNWTSRPNVYSHFLAVGYWQACVQSLVIAPSGFVKVPPEDCAAWNGFDSQLLEVIALDKLAPPWILRAPVNRQSWELSAAMLAVCVNRHEESRDSILVLHTWDEILREPVVVRSILLRLRVGRDLQIFHLLEVLKALDLRGSAENTFDNWIAFA